MNATLNMNGKGRKSLGQQIDLLDGMLDGLSEGLSGAVADAVKDAVTVAVREAVQAVVTEILSRPELRAQLRQPVTAAATDDAEPNSAEIVEQPKTVVPSRWARMRNWLSQKMQALRQTCRVAISSALATMLTLSQRAQQACVAVQQTVSHVATGSWQRLLLMRRHLRQLATALGVGVALGFFAYWVQPWLAATVGALTGVALAWLIQVGLALRRKARRLLRLSEL